MITYTLCEAATCWTKHSRVKIAENVYVCKEVALEFRNKLNDIIGEM